MALTLTGTATTPYGISVENQDILNPAGGAIKVLSNGVEVTEASITLTGAYATNFDGYISYFGLIQIGNFPSTDNNVLTFRYGDQNIVGKDAIGGNELQFSVPNQTTPFNLNAGVPFQIFFDIDEVYGCTDEYALNYLPEATDDDGSCEYDEVSFDINNDGDSNILDVVQTVEIVLNEPNPSLDNYQMLDLNNDNTINVLDVILMVSFILGRIGL